MAQISSNGSSRFVFIFAVQQFKRRHQQGRFQADQGVHPPDVVRLVGIGQVSAIPRHQDTAPVQGGEGHLMQEKAREGWPSLCPGHATCDKRNVSRLGMSARSTISPGTADRSRRGSAAPVGTYASLNWRSGVWTFCGLAAASEGILSESPAPWSMIAALAQSPARILMRTVFSTERQARD